MYIYIYTHIYLYIYTLYNVYNIIILYTYVYIYIYSISGSLASTFAGELPCGSTECSAAYNGRSAAASTYYKLLY